MIRAREPLFGIVFVFLPCIPHPRLPPDCANFQGRQPVTEFCELFRIFLALHLKHTFQNDRANVCVRGCAPDNKQKIERPAMYAERLSRGDQGAGVFPAGLAGLTASAEMLARGNFEGCATLNAASCISF